MFTVLDLTPMDDSLKPSIILLHPLLAPYDVDDFSLPINFPVNAQPLLHIHDNHPVIYCNRSSCDVLHNGVPAAKTPRRLRTGNTLHIRSADASKPISATYAVRVAYFSFSSDQRTEAAIGIGRVELGAALALQADTTAHFPLELPIDGKLPAPAPAGTNWDGVRDLVEDVRGRSVEEATRRRQDQASGAGTSSSSALQNPESASFATPRTYAQIINACPVEAGSSRIPSQFPSTDRTDSSTSPPPPAPCPPRDPTARTSVLTSLSPFIPSTSAHRPITTSVPASVPSSSSSPLTSAPSPSSPPLAPTPPTFQASWDPSPRKASSVPAMSHTSAPSPSLGIPGPFPSNETAGASSTCITGLSVALDRFRQGWLAARRAVLELGSGAGPISSVASSRSYTFATSASACSRLASIECAQSRLLPLLSSASSLSGHGTFSAARQPGAPSAVSSPPPSAVLWPPPIIAAPLTEPNAAAGSPTRSAMPVAPLCVSTSQLSACPTPTLHNSFLSQSPPSQVLPPLVPLTTAPHYGSLLPAWSQLHVLLRHLVASLTAMSNLPCGSQMFPPSYLSFWLCS